MGSIDVRNDSDIAGFESLLSRGPLALIYVHADFCGHCKTFSETVWNNAKKENMNVNAASVHYDMVDKTSLSKAKIEGYPSLLLVGKDKKAAEFKDDMGKKTNAMPEPPKTAAELEALLQTPIPPTVKNANSVVKTVMNNMRPTAAATAAAPSIQPSVAPAVETPLPELMTTGEKRNIFRPVSVKALEQPPDTLVDLVESQERPIGKQQLGGSYKARGGSLLSSLLEISREGAPAALLMAAASLKSHHKPTRSHRKSRRSRKTRKSRR
jgi:thiol-disulfide isomerase/thioredoxin